jgi:hypothetical protein
MLRPLIFPQTDHQRTSVGSGYTRHTICVAATDVSPAAARYTAAA